MKKTILTIKNELLKGIEKGEMKQSHKRECQLRTFFSLGIITLLGLFLVYLASFILLITHELHLFSLFGFGIHGFFEFFFGIPWVIVGLFFLLTITLYFLTFHYKFIYKKPVLYMFGSLSLLFYIIATSVIFIRPKNPIGRFMHNESFIISLFHNHKESEKVRHIWNGELTAKENGMWYILDESGDTFRVLLNKDSYIEEDILTRDDPHVIIFGDFIKDTSSIMVKEIKSGDED